MNAPRDRARRYFNQLRGLLDLSPDVFVLADEAGRFVEVSYASLKTWGYAPGELREKFYLDFVHPEDRPQTRRIASDLVEGNPVRNFSNRYLHRDGHSVPMLWSSTWVPDYHILFAVARDVTEQLQEQEARRQSEERYRVVFDQLPVPMWVYDRHTLKLIDVNSEATRIYGYSRDEFLRLSILDLTPEDRHAVIRRTAATGGIRTPPRASEWLHRKKNGELIPVSGWSHDVRFGAHDARIALSVDISERRRLEQQLSHAQRLEAVGQLAGGVAHDFNNMLTVINGLAELGLLRCKESDPLHHYFDQIRAAGERAAALTRQLLTFSSKQVLHPSRLLLPQIVDGLLPMIKRLLPAAIHIETDLDWQVGPVHVDPSQIEMVLMNLALNARDAMPDGGVLSIRVRQNPADQPLPFVAGTQPAAWAVLTVGDTGCGMTPEIADRVFEPFFTTKGQGRGTGLGLSTCYGVVRQSGGQIVFATEPGAGSVFQVYLPISPDTEELAPRTEELRETPGGQSESILLVDDDRLVRSAVSATLLQLGYRVIAQSTPSRALDILSDPNQPVHCLVTDMILPEMSGRALASQAHALRPGLPVLFISGYSGDAKLPESLSEEHMDFLPKPFSPAALAARIRFLLDYARKVEEGS